jgi:hypothetical protein
MNSDAHHFNTRSNHDLHLPMANLTVFQKGVWYSGIKVYDHLPANIKQLANNNSKFKMALKNSFLKTLFTHWRNIIIGIRILVLKIKC